MGAQDGFLAGIRTTMRTRQGTRTGDDCEEDAYIVGWKRRKEKWPFTTTWGQQRPEGRHGKVHHRSDAPFDGLLPERG